MSGEISVQTGYAFDEVAGEQITLDKLNRMVQDLTLQVRALSITEKELADNSVTSDKLAVEVSGQLGVVDGSVTVGKLSPEFVLPLAKGGTGASTAATARAALGCVRTDLKYIAITGTAGTPAIAQTAVASYTYTIADFVGSGLDHDQIRELHIFCYLTTTGTANYPQIKATYPDGSTLIVAGAQGAGNSNEVNTDKYVVRVPVDASTPTIVITIEGVGTHEFTIVGATQREFEAY